MGNPRMRATFDSGLRSSTYSSTASTSSAKDSNGRNASVGVKVGTSTSCNAVGNSVLMERVGSPVGLLDTDGGAGTGEFTGRTGLCGDDGTKNPPPE